MGAMGFLRNEHLELIDGDLIDKKMGKNAPHIIAVLLIHRWLVGVFGFLRVQKEEAIDVIPQENPRNEPEPDLAVLRESRTQLRRANPNPSEIETIVEVSDSSLAFDLNKKAPLYARAGIPEYWVLDVNDRRLFVLREPLDGKYNSVKIYSEQESVAPLAAPVAEFRVSAAFEE